jgi:hypothetical protein
MRQPRFRPTYSIKVDRLMRTIRHSLADLRLNRTIDERDRLRILTMLRDEFIRAASEEILAGSGVTHELLG